jgi:hypothetical protein
MCLVIVAHIVTARNGITKLWKRWRIADCEARRKCHCPARDATNTAVVLKQVVICWVFLAAIIENA